MWREEPSPHEACPLTSKSWCSDICSTFMEFIIVTMRSFSWSLSAEELATSFKLLTLQPFPTAVDTPREPLLALALKSPDPLKPPPPAPSLFLTLKPAKPFLSDPTSLSPPRPKPLSLTRFSLKLPLLLPFVSSSLTALSASATAPPTLQDPREKLLRDKDKGGAARRLLPPLVGGAPHARTELLRIVLAMYPLLLELALLRLLDDDALPPLLPLGSSPNSRAVIRSEMWSSVPSSLYPVHVITTAANDCWAPLL